MILLICVLAGFYSGLFGRPSVLGIILLGTALWLAYAVGATL